MTPTLFSHYTPLNPVASAIPRVDSSVRLSLNPVRDRRVTVDGAWWPHSRDAAAELPGLIAAVDQRLAGTTLRIGLRQDEWDHIPHRLPARGRQVRIGWFGHAEPHVLTMSMAGAEPIVLLVIPPGTTTGPAEAGLKLAAEDTTGFAPAEILTIAHLFTAPDVGSAYEDGSPAWENEGGYVTAQP